MTIWMIFSQRSNLGSDAYKWSYWRPLLPWNISPEAYCKVWRWDGMNTSLWIVASGNNNLQLFEKKALIVNTCTTARNVFSHNSVCKIINKGLVLFCNLPFRARYISFQSFHNFLVFGYPVDLLEITFLFNDQISRAHVWAN